MRSFVYACVCAMSLLACSSSNNSGPVCGDGVIEGNEQCDDGAANGTTGSSCTSTCTIVQAQPVCGDGHVDPGEQCDEGSANGTAGSHCTATCTGLSYITAHWSIDCVAGTTGCTPGCPTGFDTAQVVSQKVDATGTAIGAPKIDLFNCADNTGVTSALPPGTYTEYVAITTHDGSTTYAQSLLDAVDTTTQDGTFTEHIYVNGGYLHWAWTLHGVASNSTITCATAGGDTAELVVTINSAPVVDQFTCSDGQGTTSVYPAGTYATSFDITSSANPTQPIGLGQAQNETVLDTNQVHDIGNIEIDVPGK